MIRQILRRCHVYPCSGSDHLRFEIGIADMSFDIGARVVQDQHKEKADFGPFFYRFSDALQIIGEVSTFLRG